MIRAALYARVSTTGNGQDVKNQLAALREVAARQGWEAVGPFVDDGISGAKGRDKRPAFDAMLKAATRREVDLVAAWSVDRLGRSLQDLVAFLEELRASGCDLYLHQQGIDTRTPAGRAMFQLLGVFAEFERSLIAERVRAGMARGGRSAGGRCRRVFGRPWLRR
jgi:DNA invertase Pin-like site-specific DNA recombinase